jgi:hypothetical protein
MSLPCEVSNQDPRDDATATQEVHHAPEDVEMSATEALISFVAMLDRQPIDGRPVTVAAGTLSELSLMLLHYRRALEDTGMRGMTLPTLREREQALTAYQCVRRRVTTLLSVLRDALGERRQ